MNACRFAPLVALCGLVACTKTPAPEHPPVVAFSALMNGVRVMPLGAGQDSTVVTPVGTLVTTQRIVVLDRGRADLRAFSRTSGTMERSLGAAGDGIGQLRKPAAIAALDSGQFVVLDAGRKQLSFRDSLGAVLREVALPDGAFTSMVAFPAERRIVLAGKILYVSKEVAKFDLHEVDFDGKLIASYGEKANPGSQWETAFSTVFVVGAGEEVATGTLSSNRIRFIDRRTKSVRWLDVGTGWYVPLEWPSDRLLQRGATQQGAARIVAAWTRSHRLLNGLFPLSDGRVLARFQAFSPSGNRFFYYSLTDKSGKQIAVTQPTRAQVLSTRGDTLFWIAGSGTHTTSFGSGIVTTSSNAQISWVVPQHSHTPQEITP